MPLVQPPLQKATMLIFTTEASGASPAVSLASRILAIPTAALLGKGFRTAASVIQEGLKPTWASGD